IHLGASLDLALVHLVAAVGLQDGLHALRGEAYPFAQKLVDGFTVSYHWNVLIYWAILAVVHALDYHHDLEERRLHAAALEAQLRALHDTVAARSRGAGSAAPPRAVARRGRRAQLFRAHGGRGLDRGGAQLCAAPRG